MQTAANIFSYRKFWASRFGSAPFLPMSREEMDLLGWDVCDIILITGDAYVDHPSFGMAVIGRVLESQGFRVGIISQPDWTSTEAFMSLGEPTLFFGITSGNMDSMVNRYTADRRRRSDDAYTPDASPDKRPDRATIVYSQRCREAYQNIPLIIGGIEASLRRIAHYDYWSDKVRRSILLDTRADMLVYGNGERQIIEIAHRMANGEKLKDIRDIRGTAFVRREIPDDRDIIVSSDIDQPGPIEIPASPYQETSQQCAEDQNTDGDVIVPLHAIKKKRIDRANAVIKMPSYEQVKSDPALYAHASRVMHLETNPGNARVLVQAHNDRYVWINPPPIPLTTAELDGVFDLPYQRQPHPEYRQARLPAYEMIRYSVNIMRGCFGGCTFCSITEHEGRIIQSRSEDSVIKEIEAIRDTVPGFTGHISDVGGPTANMYRQSCKSPEIESACRRLSCVYPDICTNLNTSHQPLIQLYKRARALPGIKKILVASGLRYDLALRSPEYIKELVSHHVGGYLKIAPEHTETGPLSKMMKPAIGSYDQFKVLFDKFSREAGKEQYLIPYFIAAHPGTTEHDMLNLALWLKKNDFRLDQVQTFLPSPMAVATAMYFSGKNPLRKVKRDSEHVESAKGLRKRRLHKAFLRYHDPENWPLLREALKAIGRDDLIGNGKKHLVPAWQPRNARSKESRRFSGDHATKNISTKKNTFKKRKLSKSSLRRNKTSD